jgi:hypothetical protein
VLPEAGKQREEGKDRKRYKERGLGTKSPLYRKNKF